MLCVIDAGRAVFEIVGAGGCGCGSREVGWVCVGGLLVWWM